MSGAVPPALAALAWAWVGLVGAVVGSFLNVVIARVPRGESIAWPGSRCPHCRTPIRWYDNLPIISWLALRARCRACKAPISPRYPLVEALGAGVALVVVARHGLAGAAVAELAFADVLLALAFIDLDTWLLPNALTWALIAFGILMGPLGVTPATTLRYAVYGAGLGFAAFAALAWGGEKLLKKEALGFGDVWLLAGFGAWFGPLPLLPIVLLASLQGSVVGIALLLLGKGQRGPPEREPTAPAPAGEEEWVPPKHAVPFGPFLVAGALEWLWVGDLLARAVPALDLFR